MGKIPIIIKNGNLEILAKIINSVAGKYDCHVDYIPGENRLEFHGDQDCCRHITEETLTIFTREENTLLPFNCPVD